MNHQIKVGFDFRGGAKAFRHDRLVLVEALGKTLIFEVPKAYAPLNIINESNLTGGENVGGSTAASAAPEVAADDDDGDGDADPEPEQRPQRRSTRKSVALPPAQLSRPKAACALLGIGRTKLHHLSECDPRFPRKIVLGPRCVGWRTDALLDYLRLCEQEG